MLKICGMRMEENIRQVAALRPDYIGFIFSENSKRFVGEEFRVPEKFPATIKRVGVFVNQDISKIRRVTARYSLDFVQLHGEEPVEMCAELKRDGIGVIKVFSIGDNFDFRILEHYKRAVNLFLFDTKGIASGGNGQAFNWRILDSYDQEIPFFLSGGISLDNIKDVSLLNKMNLHALDVNSRVELEPGVKDIGLIRQLEIEMRNL